MFLRINDSYNIQKKKGFLQFLNAKRKNQEVRKFKIKDTTLEFFEEELETRMIPKNKKENFNGDIPLMFVVVGNHFLIFQDIGNTVNFLTINDEGEITKIPSYELCVGSVLL